MHAFIVTKHNEFSISVKINKILNIFSSHYTIQKGFCYYIVIKSFYYKEVLQILQAKSHNFLKETVVFYLFDVFALFITPFDYTISMEFGIFVILLYWLNDRNIIKFFKGLHNTL